jgi:hypothetical protein
MYSDSRWMVCPGSLLSSCHRQSQTYIYYYNAGVLSVQPHTITSQQMHMGCAVLHYSPLHTLTADRGFASPVFARRPS